MVHNEPERRPPNAPDRIFEEVTGEYAALMRYASYLQGHLAGIAADLTTAPGAEMALRGHWFMPTFERLASAFGRLWENYAQWDDLTDFRVIGDIAEDLIAEGSVTVQHLEGDEFYVDVPLHRCPFENGRQQQ